MKIVDLFSGCGGLSLGFQNAGFEIICAYDNWSHAFETYKKNFNHPIYNLDLSDEKNYAHIKQHNADIIIGGPPCQDFSSAGKRNENNGRADLTIHFANIIALNKPKWFVMENVQQITKSNTLIKAKEIFKNSNYGLSQVILNASLCGVPQNRKRFFLIGELNGLDNTLTSLLSDNQNTKPMSVFDYLGNSLKTEHYYRHPRSYERRGIFSIYEPSPTIRGVNRPIPPKYNFHKGDTVKDFSKVRPLTQKERSYLQTFPESFEFIGAKTNVEQMIGNAVPVKLAEYLATNLKGYINKTIKPKKNRYIQTELRVTVANNV
ncbi:DNA cytosine methyltransferase [Flavicella sp.]|uniref:DNA cytosine methyltransferase n=1 Tax=Flavicella sp. TaxID=2957742 RepID=UPI0030185AAF